MKNKLFSALFVTIGVLLGALFFQQQFSLGAFAPISVPAGGTGFSSTSIGTLIAGGTTATSTLRATSSPTVGYITATSTTATSTFANGINILGGCLRIGGSCLSTTIAPSIDWQKESNFGVLTLTASTSIPYWAKQSIYASSTLITSDRVGIATSTSGAMLSVQGNALFSGDLTLANITASGTATTTNIRVSDTLTIGGDNITELVGTGLTLSGSTLTTSLGTSVDLGSAEVTGTLLVANGGTGSTTLGGILLGDGTSAVSATGTVSVAWGGTGVGSFTLNSILVGNNNGALIASTSLGNDVISDGLTLTNITQITNRAITDLSGTLLVANGGTGSTTLGGILVGAGTSAVSATGTVAVSNGGTGANSFTLNSILVGNANGALIASTTLGNDVISDGLTLTNLTQITNRAISDTTGTLLVGRGGTGAITLGDTELLVGAGTGAVTSTSTLSLYRGGTGRATLALGNVLFGDTTSPVGLSANFYWDNVNLRLGIGTSTPGTALSVHGNSLVSGTSTTANLVATGTIALASSTIQIHQYPSFTVSTSTSWTGTTTKYLGIAFTPERWAGVRCMTDVGSTNLVFGDATTSPNAMNLLNASTTVGDFKLTENNTFTVGEKRFVAIGTPLNSPTVVSCTIDKIIN